LIVIEKGIKEDKSQKVRMFHVKHSDFVFCVAANFLIVALEQVSGGGESLL